MRKGVFGSWTFETLIAKTEAASMARALHDIDSWLTGVAYVRMSHEICAQLRTLSLNFITIKMLQKTSNVAETV